MLRPSMPSMLRRPLQLHMKRRCRRMPAVDCRTFASSCVAKADFELPANFIAQFSERQAPFGFNGLGELVYIRSYSRRKDGGQKERWHETVERVVNGTFRMQQKWCNEKDIPWDDQCAQTRAQDMYSRIFDMKFLPPGRGLWAMGTAITDKGLYAALNNCAFVSTEMQADDTALASQPFCFLMDAAMLGVGVGFDTKGANTIHVRAASQVARSSTPIVIPDSREGWVESVRMLLDTYLYVPEREAAEAGAEVGVGENLGTDAGVGVGAGAAGQGQELPDPPLEYDYSGIRPAGTPIRGFGGTASGPAFLEELHDRIHATLAPLAVSADLQGERSVGVGVTGIVDIMNLIGKCVVSGNVRRTAEIAFGDPLSDEFLDLKNYERNPDRAAYGWTSNNSVFAELGMDYAQVAERVGINGEPGIAWLENMRAWGRMQAGVGKRPGQGAGAGQEGQQWQGGQPEYKDHKAAGGNPCLEQTLESYELCCLVETFPANHAHVDDYLDTLRCAFEYAKTVTLAPTHWPQSNEVMSRNRRIGCSMTGIVQFMAQQEQEQGQGQAGGGKGLKRLMDWCEQGYDCVQATDEELSRSWGVPTSIKTTCVKPSGTVSLLAGATPGVHHPESRFYIRRVRLPASAHDLLLPLREHGYAIEPAVDDPDNTMIVSMPVDAGEGVRTQREVSLWEQLGLAAFMQRHWADNQVSCTVTFDPQSEASQIENALVFFQYQLKGISFLPRIDTGAYPQMPYEEIDAATYDLLKAQLKTEQVDFTDAYENILLGDLSAEATEVPDLYCDADTCVIPSSKVTAKASC